MHYRLRTLLILLALAPAVLPGCGQAKVEMIQDGADNVDRHAKEIEQAAKSQSYCIVNAGNGSSRSRETLARGGWG